MDRPAPPVLHPSTHWTEQPRQGRPPRGLSCASLTPPPKAGSLRRARKY
jgi:hypothetical protein